MYELAVNNLGKLKVSYLEGKIGPSGGGILGLSKNIGEFDEGEQYHAAYEIDAYFGLPEKVRIL